MKTLDLIQGTPEWHAARRKYYRTASRAPVIMGASRYQTVEQLMLELSTGITEEITPAKEALFAAGHATEALAREILIARLDDDLYPTTGLSDDEYMLASLDGVPLSERFYMEHKLLNQKVVAQIRAKMLEPMYYWQLEHGLIVCNKAEKAIFVCSDGTEQNFHTLDYVSVPARRAALLARWKQFDVDYAAYVPKVKAAPVVPKTRVTLPAVIFETKGTIAVTANLEKVKGELQTFIDAIPTEPTTDQHFVDIIEDCRSLGTFETDMKGRIQSALEKAGPLYDFVKGGEALIAIAATARNSRTKLVDVQKENLKLKAINRGRDGLAEHLAALNKRLEGDYITSIAADFAGAIKGKRTVATQESAMNQELARAKAEATQLANTIAINLMLLGKQEADHLALFADKMTIVMKPIDDFANLVTLRIGTHKAAEEAKAQKIREDATAAATAKAKAESDAAAKLAADAAAKATADAVEAARLEERTKVSEPSKEPKPAPELAPAELAQHPMFTGGEPAIDPAPQTTVFSAELPARIDGTDRANFSMRIGGGARAAAPMPEGVVSSGPPVVEPVGDPTLTITKINERLAEAGVKTDGAGLSLLGFEPTKVKGASLYHEAVYLDILRAILDGIRQLGLAAAASLNNSKE